MSEIVVRCVAAYILGVASDSKRAAIMDFLCDDMFDLGRLCDDNVIILASCAGGLYPIMPEEG